MSNQKSNWADDSDSEDELAGSSYLKLQKEEEETEEDNESEEDDDESEDDENDVDFENKRVSAAVEVEGKKEPKKLDISQLSKAERKALKQKELNDLDSMLAEFGVEKSINEDKKVELVDENAIANTSTVQSETEKDMKKKKKKNSSIKKKDEKLIEGDVITSNEDKVVSVLVTDVASLLKNKISKVKKPITENQAISEALKESQAKKKKSKDKTKYNEYSY